jgi:hypothetical protein
MVPEFTLVGLLDDAGVPTANGARWIYTSN